MNELLSKLKEIHYDKLNVDEFIDLRENDPFDSEWIRIYRTIKELKKGRNVKDTRDLAKKAYMLVFEQSTCADLAEFISDDFGLIADSKALNYSDEWLSKMISCYENAIIPCGEL